MDSDTFVELAKQHLRELDREAERHRLANSGRVHPPLRHRLPMLPRIFPNRAFLLAWFGKRWASRHRCQPAAPSVDSTALPHGVRTPEEEIARVEIYNGSVRRSPLRIGRRRGILPQR
jgi:hypothetical protein